MADDAPPLRVLVAGATGYIGRAVVEELVRREHEVVALARPGPSDGEVRGRLAGAELRFCDVTEETSVRQAGFRGERFDAVVCCLATRTGAPDDAWTIEHDAPAELLAAAKATGTPRFVLLSALCVQKPRLAFQHAKLAFEAKLMASGLTWTIVRPTAFFKSLAGQVEKVKAGRPFLMFGDGTLTACKPISERDLGSFIADAVDSDAHADAIRPVGGPGPALTPAAQAELLFSACGRPPRFRRVPLFVFRSILAVLSVVSRIVPRLRDSAELARIGEYYATESMLVWDAERQRYDAEATPSYGTDTLEAFIGGSSTRDWRGKSSGRTRSLIVSQPPKRDRRSGRAQRATTVRSPDSISTSITPPSARPTRRRPRPSAVSAVAPKRASPSLFDRHR